MRLKEVTMATLRRISLQLQLFSEHDCGTIYLYQVHKPGMECHTQVTTQAELEDDASWLPPSHHLSPWHPSSGGSDCTPESPAHCRDRIVWHELLHAWFLPLSMVSVLMAAIMF
jgi:hypothetical protein